MHAPDKNRISAAFDRAAHNYDQLAHFQHAVCDDLARFLCVAAPQLPEPASVLDGGCGTGYGSGLLKERWPRCHLTGCDLSIEMLKLAENRQIDIVLADLEQLPFRSSQFDFIWSSLALQWCKTPDVYIELYRTLKDDGILLFATLGPGTLIELDAAFSDVDAHRHVRPFSSPREIELALKKTGFKNVRILNETRTTRFEDFNSFLASVRGIGANQVGSDRRRSMMGKNTWEKAKERYESFRDSDGLLPATYELIFGFAVR